MRKPNNKRNFLRVDALVNFVAGIVPHEEREGIKSRILSDAHWDKNQTKRVDISVAGMLFNSEDFYSLGDVVAIKLTLGKDIPSLLVYGRVVRVEPALRYCRVAVGFEAVDKQIQSIIMRFVSFREREIISEKRIGWI